MNKYAKTFLYGFAAVFLTLVAIQMFSSTESGSGPIILALITGGLAAAVRWVWDNPSDNPEKIDRYHRF